MATTSVTLKVSWGKVRLDVPCDLSKSGLELKQEILKLTGVPIERQKLMAKGAWVATLRDDADLSSLTIKEGQAVMLMGTAEVAPSVAAAKEVRKPSSPQPPQSSLLSMIFPI